MALSKPKFAELAGVSRRAVYKQITAGALVVRPDGKLDPNNPVNQDYINKNKKTSDSEQPDIKKGSKKTKQKTKPATPEDDKHVIDGQEIDLGNIPQELNGLNQAELNRIKIAEQILDIRVKRQKLRDELIDRRLVRILFSKIYTVDVNEFLTIKDKLMPDIAAIFGINDPEIIMKAGERMDDELWKTLKHIKQIIDDFLVSFGDEVLD